MDKAAYGPCDPIVVTVQLRNNGTRDSDEVVQLYVKQPDATVPAPRVRLGAFARVHVRKGASVSVVLTLRPEAHSVVTSDEGGEAIYGASADQSVQKGSISLHVGGGQPDYYAGSISARASITATAPLSSCA